MSNTAVAPVARARPQGGDEAPQAKSLRRGRGRAEDRPLRAQLIIGGGRPAAAAAPKPKQRPGVQRPKPNTPAALAAAEAEAAALAAAVASRLKRKQRRPKLGERGPLPQAGARTPFQGLGASA
jgi:hypothetical protein